jgi:hypothetical protein
MNMVKNRRSRYLIGSAIIGTTLINYFGYTQDIKYIGGGLLRVMRCAKTGIQMATRYLAVQSSIKI